MAQAYGDDLRRKVLSAYKSGKVTMGEVAARFDVSYGWVQKIARAERKTGSDKRTPFFEGGSKGGGPPLGGPPFFYAAFRFFAIVFFCYTREGFALGFAVAVFGGAKKATASVSRSGSLGLHRTALASATSCRLDALHHVLHFVCNCS